MSQSSYCAHSVNVWHVNWETLISADGRNIHFLRFLSTFPPLHCCSFLLRSTDVRKLREIIWALSVTVSQGKLKEWSLVLYGTSVQPYSPTNEFPKVERFRYSRVEDPTDDYGAEDYAGELYITLRRLGLFLACKVMWCNCYKVWLQRCGLIFIIFSMYPQSGVYSSSPKYLCVY